jgi:uracil-DNA glycosylase
MLKFLDENWDWSLTLEKFCTEKNTPAEWSEFFKESSVKAQIEKISGKIDNEVRTGGTIFPPINLVFRVFSLPAEKIKVVILGMDPYHNEGSATGLCFSVPRGSSINPSLRNIYKELVEEFGQEFGDIKGTCASRQDGDLQDWFKQGVFLLNSALTVREGSPDSHIQYWNVFTRLVIGYISQRTNHAAWLFMGARSLAF